MLKTSKLNIKWDGLKDWLALSKKEKQEKIKMGPIFHDAHCSVPKRKAFVRGQDKISIFTTPIPDSIAIGTTKASITKFWTGFGVLEKREKGFADRILSPSQFEKVKNLKHSIMKIDLVPLKNFQKIWLFPERLNFTDK